MTRKRDRHRVADRFMPTLLDRLSESAEGEGGQGAHLSRSAYHETVLRDLAWLLNCVSADGELDLAAYPRVRDSVLNFGIPPLAGRRFSETDLEGIAAGIRRAILTFEPRVIADTLTVSAVRDPVAESHNQIVFQIRAAFWFEPYPLEMSIRAKWDSEVGLIDVSGAS